MFLALSLAVLAADAKEDPSETFLKAFIAFQRAEKAEAGGLKQEAIDDYRLAENLLKSVQDSNAEWNPAIVEHRVKKVAERLERVRVAALAADAKEDASETFLKAFLAFQRAEAAEARGLKQEAIDDYRLAERLLKSVRNSNAEWNPAIVEHRFKKVVERLERVRFAPLAADAEEDASETFLKAFLAFQRAEAAEARGLKQEAVDDYRLAEKLLKSVRDSNAEWNPAIVEHRFKKVAERLERVSEN